MTNKEAITVLQKYMFLNEDDELYTEAVRLAIKALDLPTMISRLEKENSLLKSEVSKYKRIFDRYK